MSFLPTWYLVYSKQVKYTYVASTTIHIVVCQRTTIVGRINRRVWNWTSHTYIIPKRMLRSWVIFILIHEIVSSIILFLYLFIMLKLDADASLYLIWVAWIRTQITCLLAQNCSIMSNFPWNRSILHCMQETTMLNTKHKNKFLYDFDHFSNCNAWQSIVVIWKVNV